MKERVLQRLFMTGILMTTIGAVSLNLEKPTFSDPDSEYQINVHLPLVLRDHPSATQSTVPQIDGYLKYVPDHRSKAPHVWEWGANVEDPDANLREFCTSTSERPDQSCIQRPSHIKSWGLVSAKGYIYHSAEKRCASIEIEVTDDAGNETIWEDKKCLP